MLRSLYSAVSGVKAHQTYLDVTGNNIANVNTVGFKRDVIHFRDMIYQTSKNPSQPNPSIPIGGVNPAQVGLGVTVGSIETVHTQGSLQNTGIPTDMAIQGSGYFVVNNGTQQLYTRAGNFSLDRDGNLVMQGNGYLVQGYAYKDVIDPATGNLTREKDSNLTGINIPIGEKIPAKATTLAAFRCNLCSTATAEITDMTSIPGGETKVARPHDYTSYAGKEVTYVGDSAARTAKKGVSGETFFDTETGQIFEWGLSGASGWETNETVDDFGADVTTDPDTPSSIPIGYKYFNTNDMLLYVYTQGTYDAGRQTKVGAIVSQNPTLWNPGDVFFNTTTNTFYTFEGDPLNNNFNAGIQVTYSGTDSDMYSQVGSPNETFYNTTDQNIYTWDSGAWQHQVIVHGYGPSLPSNPSDGYQIYNTNDNTIYEYKIVPQWNKNPGGCDGSFPSPPQINYLNGDLFVLYSGTQAYLYEYNSGTQTWDPDGVTNYGTNAQMQSSTAVAGDLFYVTDIGSMGLYRYDGTIWIPQTIVGSGSSLPPNVVMGTRYFNTTANISGKYDIYEWDGSAWNVVDTVDAYGLAADRPATSTPGFKYYGTDDGDIHTYSARGEWSVVETVTDEVNTSADLPVNAAINSKYFSMDDKKIYTYSGNTWVTTSTGVSNVGNTEPASGVNGEKFFNTATKEIKTFSPVSEWVNPTAKQDDTYYYGVNAGTIGAGVFGSVYSDGQTSGVTVSSRVIVDDSRALPSGSTNPGRTPNRAGETFLDTATGIIYTANSTATGWLTPATPEKMSANTAYSVSIAAGPNNIYVLDSTGVPAAVSSVMDSSVGNKNVFVFNATLKEWKSINDNYGLSPSSNSTTTQATITAFGESMIKSSDWEDKFTVYDSRGNPYTMNVAFRKVMDRPADPTATPPVGAESEWDWYAYYTDSDGNVLPQYGQGAGTLVFGDDGLLKRTYTYTPEPPIPDPNGTNAPLAPQYATWEVVEKVIDKNSPDYNASVHDSLPTGLVVADFNTAGAQGSVNNNVSPITYSSNMITLDFLGSDYAKTLGLTSDPIDGVTNYGSESTTKLSAQDGYAMGVLNDWTIGGDGIITGAYSNGRNLAIAQIALAMFANPQGLSKVGETCFAETINSGIAQVGAPQTNGAGSVQGNTIEMSNVDLSEEFVSLIRAQRGFQANTRVVTTSDQVLEELINMKR